MTTEHPVQKAPFIRMSLGTSVLSLWMCLFLMLRSIFGGKELILIPCILCLAAAVHGWKRSCGWIIDEEFLQVMIWPRRHRFPLTGLKLKERGGKIGFWFPGFKVESPGRKSLVISLPTSRTLMLVCALHFMRQRGVEISSGLLWLPDPSDLEGKKIEASVGEIELGEGSLWRNSFGRVHWRFSLAGALLRCESRDGWFSQTERLVLQLPDGRLVPLSDWGTGWMHGGLELMRALTALGVPISLTEASGAPEEAFLHHLPEPNDE